MTQRRRVADHPSRASPGSCLERSLPVRGSRTSTRARIQPFLRYRRISLYFRNGRDAPTGLRRQRARARPGTSVVARARGASRRRRPARRRGGSRGCGPACPCGIREPQLKNINRYCSIDTAWFTINDLYAAFVFNRPNARSLPFLIRLRARAVGPLRRGWIPSCTCAARAPPSRLADQPPSCPAAPPQPHVQRSHGLTSEVSRFPVLCCVH